MMSGIKHRATSVIICGGSCGRWLSPRVSRKTNSIRRKEYIQYLIDIGIDPAITDSFGKTAYDYAVEDGHTEIADLLSRTP